MALATRHSLHRFSERIGISKDYAEQHFKDVLLNGLDKSDFRKGSEFRKWLVRLKENKHGEPYADNVRRLVYGHFVYIVSEDNKFITLFPVPHRFYEFLRERF